ncbi:thermonuclease family protein [Emcibacter sp. SYSU 3D8]|uniref:thermonuclease family protein n=1 Tax=Emcibacter sp. SYSU 3D8 TaxID=3133969 RepID=UPI0031FED30E
MRWIWAAALMVLFSSPAALADVRVHDGDTITLDGTKIRIAAIDAPELDQKCATESGRCMPCGAVSKGYLLSLLAKGAPVCVRIDTDRYGRAVATCTVNGRDIGEAMIRSGNAVAYTRYLVGDQARRYPAAEAASKKGRRGIWAGRYDMPERWRRGERIKCEK